MSKKLVFPDNFLWGTSTSAYQVEGGIDKNDWAEKFPAGKACDQYNRYEIDFDLLEELNQSAHRISIEWSRVETEEGSFNQKEIEHYKNLLKSLKRRKIKTMVTLCHFTSPVWFSSQGGWGNSKSPFYFNRFACLMIKECGDLVDFWITINEPLIHCSKGFLTGNWPPFLKNIFIFKKAVKNQILAHRKVFKNFHKLKKDVRVGIAKNNQFFEPYRKKNVFDKFSCFLSNYFCNVYFLKKINRHLDFIGLNYYFHRRLKFPYEMRNKDDVVSDLGWEIYPKGIYYLLLQLKRYNLPVYITENGLSDKNDELRKDFIKKHLLWIYKAIKKGVDVRGYFHWSLIDNFEWDKGFDPKFGLVEVNYDDFSRKPRPSFYYYSEISKNNYLTDL